MPLLARLFFALGAWLALQPAQAGIEWHWDDDFTAEEQAKLTRWIGETISGVEAFVRPFPFDVHVTFVRAERGDGPVPWANTVRYGRQGIRFHVNPEHSLEAFLDDWTAAHELSHLLIPYLGKRHSWFAEGFASYMQFQVLHEMGVIDREEMQRRYRLRIARAEDSYDLHDIPFADAAPRLRARREYRTMYWGGAVYFFRVQRRLAKAGTSMPEVLREFVDCCRRRTRGLDGLIGTLDRIAGEPAFSEELALLRSEPGFPVTDRDLLDFASR